MEVNFQSVVDNVPAMIYVYAVNHENGESSFPFVSDYCQEMFGFSASQVMEDPKVLVNAILEEEAEQYAAAVMESMEHLTPFDRLGRMRRADGRIIDVHYKSRPRLVEETNNGKVTTFTVWDGIVFDVTRQVSNEGSNRIKLQRMIDRTEQPVFQVDAHLEITQWNAPMARVTEYSRTEAMGQPVVGFMPEEERGAFASFLASSTGGERTSESEKDDQLQHCECTFETRENKKKVYLHSTCSVSRDANWSETGRLFCCHDITMLKEAEKQKDAALELVDAERGLTEWLSHEVRNPLSVSMEAAMAMKENNDCCSAENRWHIDLVIESIHYIVDLLTNMLDLNKCIEGKVTLSPSSCKIRDDVLGPTCRMMGLPTRAGKVRLELVDGVEVTCEVDKLRLRQIVTNLISNALKFTTKGFVKVELNDEHSTRGRRSMKIVVSDSGCGVKPNDYDALFSKWEQLGSQANGAGIGLCLSRALARAMGGDITLDKSYISGFDGYPGARFIVDIPLSSTVDDVTRLPAFESLSIAVVASKRETTGAAGRSLDEQPTDLSERRSADLYVDGFEEPEEKSPKEQSYSDSAIRGKYTILVVDDDKMGRKLLRRRFSRLFPDSAITEVASGEDALLETESRIFDIITIDHFMAVDEMSGEDTIRALRSREIDSLVIGISGNLKEKEHLAAGAQHFFQKPIPSDRVLVTRLLENVSPPGNWKVLCVDDVKVNIHFLIRRLRKVASPHFTSLQESEKRWDITSRASGEEAVAILKDEWFDLVIVDQHLGEGMSGSSVASFVRDHAINREAIVVLNSGSLRRVPEGEVPYNLFWSKPLPSTEKMRTDLCKALLECKKDV